MSEDRSTKITGNDGIYLVEHAGAPHYGRGGVVITPLGFVHVSASTDVNITDFSVIRDGRMYTRMIPKAPTKSRLVTLARRFIDEVYGND